MLRRVRRGNSLSGLIGNCPGGDNYYLCALSLQAGKRPYLLQDVPELVDALIRMKQERELVRISPLLAQLTVRELEVVEKVVKEARSGRLPLDFTRALTEARSARAKEKQGQPPSGGLFGGLIRRLGSRDRNG